MKQKDLYALMVSVHFVDDDLKASPSSSFNLCCSYDKEKLDHYCSVLQEASDIRFKLRPSNTVVEYLNNDGTKDYAFFTHLSSTLDFIHSNFK